MIQAYPLEHLKEQKAIGGGIGQLINELLIEFKNLILFAIFGNNNISRQIPLQDIAVHLDSLLADSSGQY